MEENEWELLDRRRFEFIVSPKKVAGCSGGTQNVDWDSPSGLSKREVRDVIEQVAQDTRVQ